MSRPAATVALAVKGPAWAEGRPLREQPGLPQHLRFMGDRLRDGTFESAGPFAELDSEVEGELVGMAVFVDAGVEAAERILLEDPAQRAELLHWQVRSWHR